MTISEMETVEPQISRHTEWWESQYTDEDAERNSEQHLQGSFNHIPRGAWDVSNNGAVALRQGGGGGRGTRREWSGLKERESVMSGPSF